MRIRRYILEISGFCILRRIMISPESLARRLPDTAAYVDTRGLLLSRPCEIFGQDPGTGNFVVRARYSELICVAGEPAPAAIRQAIKKSGPTITVLSNLDNGDFLASVLPDWKKSKAILHELKHSSPVRSHLYLQVSFVSREQIESIAADAPDLAGELDREFAFTPIAATFVNRKPISFCFPTFETESLWDVSIETLPAFRRRGYAAACFKFMREHMQEEGKRPIWGAEADNKASLQLARKLGFVPVDEVVLFTLPEKKKTIS